MAKQQKVNKFQRDLKKTQNTFNDDPVIRRDEQVRRDNDNVRTPEINLYQIDYAIAWYMKNHIKPHVVEDGELIPVPVVYASAEKWASVQRNGYFRDKKGKMMLPLIMIRRTDMAPRDQLAKLEVRGQLDNNIIFRRKWSKLNRYDRFSQLNNMKPANEMFQVGIPDYVDVTYEVVVWCEYASQVNKLVEEIIFWEGSAWGDTYKFITVGQSYSFETVNAPGEDRIAKATVSLKSQAHLIPKDPGLFPNMKKFITPKTVVWGQEVVADINNLPLSETSPLPEDLPLSFDIGDFEDDC